MGPFEIRGTRQKNLDYLGKSDSLFKSFSTSLNAFKLFVIMRKAADGSIVKSQYVITF